MEKVGDRVYICNSKMLLLKLDLAGEQLYLKQDKKFLEFLDAELEKYDDLNPIDKINSIMPATATKAEFILSNNCNMNCIYCYSSMNRNSKRLNFVQAKAVIDRLISNSLIKDLKMRRNRKIYLSFHGGGEPSYEMELLRKIVDYANCMTNKYNTKLCLEITTNLSFSDDSILDFYLENGFFVHVSMDGVAKVQNYQRPYVDGLDSYNTVMNNIRYLSDRNGHFSIRLTVTDYSISYVSESVKLLKENFPNVQFIKLAPLECTERSENSKINAPELSMYIKALEEVDLILGNDGYYSIFGEADALINRGMCASVRFEQIIVSPEGVITTCHENPLAECFSYGRVSSEGRLEIDEEKVIMLKNERTQNIYEGNCSKCAFRYLCMGGCKHRMQTADKNMFCSIEKYSLRKIIEKMFDISNIKNYKNCQKDYSFGKDKSKIHIISLGGL